MYIKHCNMMVECNMCVFLFGEKQNDPNLPERAKNIIA